MGNVTIYDVAGLAGVSISTVSQTLNRPERVNVLTRERVLDAIEQLGYVPSATAADQARGGSGRIGVLAPFSSYASFHRRLTGVLTGSGNASRDIVLYDNESAAASQSPLLRTLPVNGRLAGLLIMGLPVDDELAESLIRRRQQTVLIDSSRPEFSSVNIDDEEGGAIAARHLLAAGHDCFAFVQEPQESFAFVSQGQRRNIGFLAEMSRAGLDEDRVHTVLASNDISGGRKALHEVLSRNPRPTAVFAHHDVLAAGVLLECRSAGVRVPDDLAIVGFDDADIAEAAGLTTIRQHFEESGRIGMRLLEERLTDATTPVQRIVLRLELVERDTT